MSTQYTAERLKDVKRLSKKDYIDKYNDPFEDSIDVLNLPDSSIDDTMSEAEKDELEAYEKKRKEGSL